MSLRRQISWSAATRDMRADRAPVDRSFIAARMHVSMTVRATRVALVTSTGAYDRVAIMTVAIKAARAQQTRTGEAWAVCMASGLKAAWNAAKVARINRAH